ncbi:MAG: hypothetical protein KDK07_05490 [Bauldia sp.]|nr:hypothetical protein [Bauldia sp.]
MVLPLIKSFVGAPLADPIDGFEHALSFGVVTATAGTIEVADPNGYKVVFDGSFTVVGGAISSGTMTGFTVFAGATKIMTGAGYAVDGAALYDALQHFNDDDEPFFNLVFDIPIKFVGSGKGDAFQTEAGGSKLLGKGGNDALFSEGGLGTVIKGGNGNDIVATLDGGAKFWGNSGKDTFLFLLDSLQPMTSHNRIKDFVRGEDHIGLAVPDDVLTPGYLDKAHFHKGTSATKAEHMIIYDKKSGIAYFDADGSGAGAQFAFAKVDPGTKLGVDDFYVQSFIG